MATEAWRCDKHSSVWPSPARWKSSGNTWITDSVRYSCAIGSLQLMISFTSAGRMRYASRAALELTLR